MLFNVLNRRIVSTNTVQLLESFKNYVLIFFCLFVFFRDYCWAIPRRTAILGRPVTRAEQAQCISSPSKNQFNIVVAWSHVSDIKLIRTDTTL